MMDNRWLGLWTGTLRLLEQQEPRAYRLVLANLARHGLMTEKFAEKLAREAMLEPGFREQWRAAVREASQRMLDVLNSRPAPRRAKPRAPARRRARHT
jgi:hypothetical protein